MPPYRLTIPDHPDTADREAVLAPLRAFNIAQAGDPRIRPVAILLHHDHGATAGGLWGRIGFDWMFVELLVVPEDARGQGLGRQLMAQAETIARDAGCNGMWLDTFEFQARGFYEKLGFSLFGTLDDYPTGQHRYFMMKRL
ncbi:GNAT family N-acetyltransferase [Novosphingobium sp.]|uniref:GNAT family N-acetyltransferase n=1 Tax=Novosphingobium sp. TaxID=1874826 RepID=UPI003341992A